MSYRNSRPPQRSSSSDDREPSPRRAKEEAPVETAPQKANNSRTPVEPAPKRSKKRPFVVVLLVIVVAVVVGAGLYVLSQRSANGGLAPDGSKYQAVFFTNGQVYFGKLNVQNENYLKLTDIFYLQTQSAEGEESDNPQKAATDSKSDVQLIKLGDEVHGPEDEMIINRDQVLFYENLKSDGKVSQSIAKFKSSR